MVGGGLNTTDGETEFSLTLSYAAVVRGWLSCSTPFPPRANPLSYSSPSCCLIGGLSEPVE